MVAEWTSHPENLLWIPINTAVYDHRHWHVTSDAYERNVCKQTCSMRTIKHALFCMRYQCMSQVMPMKGMSVSKLVAWGQLNMHYFACVTSAAAVIFAGRSIGDLNEPNATCPQLHFLSYTDQRTCLTAITVIVDWLIGHILQQPHTGR